MPLLMQLTRLIPEAKGTTCNVELEPIENTRHSSILRVPFKTQDGQDLPHWVSRFDIYPYLERYAQVCISCICIITTIMIYTDKCRSISTNICTMAWHETSGFLCQDPR